MEFLSSLRILRPALLILGLRFRDGPTGKEMLRVLRRRPEWASVGLLVVTSSIEPGEEALATIHGADACLRTQTMSPASLCRAAGELIARSRKVRSPTRPQVRNYSTFSGGWRGPLSGAG